MRKNSIAVTLPVFVMMEELEGNTNLGFVLESNELFTVIPRRKSSLLAIDHSELNYYTYVYDATKSLRKMTVSEKNKTFLLKMLSLIRGKSLLELWSTTFLLD